MQYVVIPVYDIGKLITVSINSIFEQTINSYDLILVDDGSSDLSGHICDEFASIDSRTYVIHKPNGGLSDARNVGMDLAFARGDCEWITFIDSDDWVHPQYLETLYRAVNESGLKISSCTLKRTSQYDIEDSVDCGFSVESSEDVYTQFETKAVSYAVARLYHKSLFENVRFPKGKLFEDVFTSYKIFLSVDRIAYIKAILSTLRKIL